MKKWVVNQGVSQRSIQSFSLVNNLVILSTDVTTSRAENNLKMFVSTQGLPDNVSTVGKSENKRITKKIKWWGGGATLIYFVYKIIK